MVVYVSWRSPCTPSIRVRIWIKTRIFFKILFQMIENKQKEARSGVHPWPLYSMKYRLKECIAEKEKESVCVRERLCSLELSSRQLFCGRDKFWSENFQSADDYVLPLFSLFYRIFFLHLFCFCFCL